MLPEDIEIIYVIFDICNQDGESTTSQPLHQRHARLATALREAPPEGCQLEGGATPVKGRLLRLLPGAEAPLIPGAPVTAHWSVQGNSARAIEVRSLRGCGACAALRARLPACS